MNDPEMTQSIPLDRQRLFEPTLITFNSLELDKEPIKITDATFAAVLGQATENIIRSAAPQNQDTEDVKIVKDAASGILKYINDLLNKYRTSADNPSALNQTRDAIKAVLDKIDGPQRTQLLSEFTDIATVTESQFEKRRLEMAKLRQEILEFITNQSPRLISGMTTLKLMSFDSQAGKNLSVTLKGQLAQLAETAKAENAKVSGAEDEYNSSAAQRKAAFTQALQTLISSLNF